MPKENTDWPSIEVDLPEGVLKLLTDSAELSGFTREEMVRAIVAIYLAKDN